VVPIDQLFGFFWVDWDLSRGFVLSTTLTAWPTPATTSPHIRTPVTSGPMIEA
jgi:hypothetical protein